MKREIGTYAVVLVVMLALDALWLGFVAQPLYQFALGHLMADPPRLGIAALFYTVYALGLTLFGVRSQAAQPGWGSALRVGGLFGFFCYATYDLTNLATLKDWPVFIAPVDIAWGTVVSGISAAVGKRAWDRLSH